MDELILGAGERDALGRIMASLPLQLPPGVPMEAAMGGGGVKKKESVTVSVGVERVPQWSSQETRDFIAIRAELERNSMVSRRNKTLWEAVSSRMRERGYRRSPEQCKCKWKNLVNRYKGKETSDPEAGRQCPFFDELHAVFTERARKMQRLLLESESGGPQPKNKKPKRPGDKSSEEVSEDDEEERDDSDEEHPAKGKRRKSDKDRQGQHLGEKVSRASDSVHSILSDFFQLQQQMELQWRETLERRALERRMLEQDWRQSMEKLERERLMLEQVWREREEQRRIREETRAEKRDVLLTTLLNKLLQDDFLK